MSLIILPALGISPAAASQGWERHRTAVERATGQTASVASMVVQLAPDFRVERISHQPAFVVGASLVAVIETARETEFKFRIPAAGTLLPDGSILVKRGRQQALVAPPWATDANGVSLSTRYVVRGTEVTQVVDAVGAAFPIVADPRLTYGWGVYLNLWGYEVLAIGSAIIGMGGLALVALCDGASRLPVPLQGVVRILCAVVGTPSVLVILSALVDMWRNGNIGYWTCYQKRIIPNSGSYYVVSARGNCYA